MQSYNGNLESYHTNYISQIIPRYQVDRDEEITSSCVSGGLEWQYIH